MKWIAYIMELLFPQKCLLCGKVLERGETDLCGQCRVEQPLCPKIKNKYPFIDSRLALWYYEENAAKSLQRYKFSNCASYADGYGRLLGMKLGNEMEEAYSLITWVPVSRLRKFRRGYDQVELLAKALSRELGVPAVQCLRKKRNNPPQSGIHDGARRRANVLGVYAAVERHRFEGKEILLVDDIVTTGATASECARVLLTAGASKVHFAAVAAAHEHHK